MKRLNPENKNNINDLNTNEWIVFLNGKLFYLAQTHSIKDEESGKAFFESIIPNFPSVASPVKIPAYPLQFEESQVH
ncbi:MAG: hypothetical protein IPJ69_03330 [Deltaproteobacteria bacterium]|nr:MAG: hypothetical protein IPJ69_03330 [Deltaproteobacteria bacterium]